DSIRLSLCREKHNAVLVVSNEADEIGADQLSHLFERFYRTDETRHESGSHYGLGLSIAKAVAESHGGSIRAEYTNGSAVFAVSLPCKK
ncbi:MAG: GHKL domain-containing protein, partial [Clostridia bacterium]|nr:GHKL domain-containing protein [Clostridia bacterium]